MTNARVREALTAGANVKDKGPHVADGILSVTPDAPEVAEWRAKCPLDCGGPSSTYLDDDDDGPKPHELYGKFTWKIENFSEISKRELRSNVFDVGNYKWYILVYPQGCDVCNHLSLFLCVADYDKLLPGWSHFAQFTIAVVNKDPKKSKYSDTLHRFCKKEHDWGWKKFMELSKVLDGFTVAGTLVIKAQVQVILDKPSRPFRCLDPQYRRELVRVYLTNVEAICRRVCEEKRLKMAWVRENLSKFREFWNDLTSEQQKSLMTERADVILKGIVKQFFNEKEVTSTLVMDALLSGCKQIEEHSRLAEQGKFTDGAPCVIINSDRNVFTFGWGILDLLEGCSKDFLPVSKDEKPVQGADGLGLRSGQEGDEYRRDSIERDEKRLAELGRRSVEMYVIAHLFSEQLEIAFREAEALKKQDQLIAEEEEAGRREESRLQAKAVADREKRVKKKERKKLKKEAEKARKEAEELERKREDDERKVQSNARQVAPEADTTTSQANPTTPQEPAQNRKASNRNKKQQSLPNGSAATTTTAAPSSSSVPNGPTTVPHLHHDKHLPNGKAHAAPRSAASSTSAHDHMSEPFQSSHPTPASTHLTHPIRPHTAPGSRYTHTAAVGVGPNSKSHSLADLPACTRKISSSCSSSSSSNSSQQSHSQSSAKPYSRSSMDRNGTEPSTDGCTTSHPAGADGQSSRGSSQERGSEEIIRALQERVLFLEQEVAGRDSQITTLRAQVSDLETLLQQASCSSQQPHQEERERWSQAGRPASRPPVIFAPDYSSSTNDSSRLNGLDHPTAAPQSSTHPPIGPPSSSTAPSHTPSIPNGPFCNPVPSASAAFQRDKDRDTGPVQSWAATADDYSREFPPLQAANSTHDHPPPHPRTTPHTNPAPTSPETPDTTNTEPVSNTPGAPCASPVSKTSEDPTPSDDSSDTTDQHASTAFSSHTSPTSDPPLPSPLPTSSLLTPAILPPSSQGSLVPPLTSSSQPIPLPSLPILPSLAPLRRGQLACGDPTPAGSTSSSPQTLSASPAATSSAPCLTLTSSSMRIPTLAGTTRLLPAVPIPAPNPSPSDHLNSLSHPQHPQPASPVTPQLLNPPNSPLSAPSDPPGTLLRTQSMPSHLEHRNTVLLEHANGRHTPPTPLPSTSTPSLMTPAPAISLHIRPRSSALPDLLPASKSSPSTYLPSTSTPPLANGIAPSLSLHSISSSDYPSKSESSTPSYRSAAASGVLTPAPALSQPPAQPNTSISCSNGLSTSAGTPAGMSPTASVIPVSSSMVASMAAPLSTSSKKGEEVGSGASNGVVNGGVPRGFGPPPSRFGLSQQGQTGMSFCGMHGKVGAMGQRPRHISPAENPGLDDFAHINLITDLLTD